MSDTPSHSGDHQAQDQAQDQVQAQAQKRRGGSAVGGETYYLETKGLSKYYGGITALSDADFSISSHECVAIVGDNGAGKSTFVRMISGAEKPDAGDIYIQNEFVAFHSPADAHRHGIETVYQNLALADDLNVAANIFLGRELTRLNLGPFSLLNHRKMFHQSVDFLKQTGISIPNLHEPLRHMSGGQRQCIAISRASAWATQLIIMDEPTAALGVQETEKVEKIILKLKKNGIPIIIISHNLRQVFDLVDAVWVFRHGKIVAKRTIVNTSKDEIIALITGALEK